MPGIAACRQRAGGVWLAGGRSWLRLCCWGIADVAEQVVRAAVAGKGLQRVHGRRPVAGRCSNGVGTGRSLYSGA